MGQPSQGNLNAVVTNRPCNQPAWGSTPPTDVPTATEGQIQQVVTYNPQKGHTQSTQLQRPGRLYYWAPQGPFYIRPLRQDQEMRHIYLTYRNKNSKSGKMKRRKICSKWKKKAKLQKKGSKNVSSSSNRNGGLKKTIHFILYTFL